VRAAPPSPRHASLSSLCAAANRRCRRLRRYKGYKLNIWDVGGQKTIRAYWRNYFETTEALIWVVDSSDTLRLEDCRRELHKLLGEERLAGASLLIFANKQDLDGAYTSAQIEEALQLGDLKGRAVKVQGCSAVDGSGLADGIGWVVDEVASRLFLLADGS
jgi:ADP-ribosylation factor-like protein 2